ncbi:outer membrane protein assembly factor BamB family protein [Paenibacillus xanthanilyticus]|uniref:PQQ-binding-like beta-propeller repeat protein n=1 Tax=Paenibacillus xanthanilyticus TaxID=1783531 RepID=A0ABV8K6B3_9BACL
MKRVSIHKIIATAAASALLGTGLLGNAVPTLAEQPVLSRSSAIGVETITQAKPAWSIPLATFSESGWPRTAAIAEEGRVFALIGSGQLAAYDGTSGKRLWTFGHSLKPLLTYDQGMIYGLAADGSIYAVTSGGTRKWASAIGAKRAERITVTGDTVYVMQNLVFYALEKATGKLRWKVVKKAEEYYLAGYPEVWETPDVVLRKYYVDGVHSSSQINAFDKKTGKMLWWSPDIYDVLDRRENLVYVTPDLFMRDDLSISYVSIYALDVKTGKIMQQREYKWKPQVTSQNPSGLGGNRGTAFIDGDALYIFQDDIVAQYDFAAYKPDNQPVKRWNAPDPNQYFPLYKLHEGRLLYQNQHDNSIGMMKTANGGFLRTTYGVNVVQTDLYGNGLYLGLADGTLKAYDYTTTKPVFSIRAGDGNFEPTLKSGSMLYVRSGGMLLAVKLPASLTKN